MSAAAKIFPNIANRWSKQDWKRWNLCVKWLAFEHGLLEQTLGHKPTPAEHHEQALKVLTAIWDDDAQRRTEHEQRKAAQAAKVVPLRPDSEASS
jgi:hypothetical protein